MRAVRAWISEPARNRTREPMCHAKDLYRSVGLSAACRRNQAERGRGRCDRGSRPSRSVHGVFRMPRVRDALAGSKRARSAAIRSSWNRQLRRRAISALHRLVSIEHRAPPRRRSNSRPTQSFRGAHDHVPNRGRRRSRHWHAGSTPSGAFRREANLGERCTPKVRHELHKSCSWLRIGQGAARLGSRSSRSTAKARLRQIRPRSPKPPTLAKASMTYDGTPLVLTAIENY